MYKIKDKNVNNHPHIHCSYIAMIPMNISCITSGPCSINNPQVKEFYVYLLNFAHDLPFGAILMMNGS